MHETRRTFLPATGHHLPLSLYDSITKLTGIDRGRDAFVDRTGVRDGQRVVEIGCGTGALTIRIARRHPGARVLGTDPDANALARARRKAERAGARVELERAFSDELPCEDASVDHLISSFMFHHLSEEEKVRTLREARRVLAPGGKLHLLDFDGQLQKGDGVLAHVFSGHGRVEANAGDRILSLIAEAGLVGGCVVERRKTLLGGTSYYRASAPG